MLHGTIRNDDFQRNTVLQCWNNVVTIGNSVATMLQRCCAKSRRSESSRVIGGFHVYVIAAMVNKRSLISSFFLSTSIFSFHHRYLCLPRLHGNQLYHLQSCETAARKIKECTKKCAAKLFFFTNQKKGVLHVQSCWFADQIYCCFLPFSLSAYHLYGNFGEKFPSNGTGIIFWHRKQEQG